MSARIPLDRQIAAAERALVWLSQMYSQRVARGQMSKQEANEHIGELEAVVKTLHWLADNQAIVRGAIEWIREEPAVKVMLETFPGSKIVGFRRSEI